MRAPARLVWLMSPLPAANDRQPLPPVTGSPGLRVLRADPTPRKPSARLSFSVGCAYLVSPGASRVSQVPNASLRACHALETPPELHHLAQNGGFTSASVSVTTSPSGSLPSRGGTTAFGADQTSGMRFPCGLRGSLCTLQLLRSGWPSSEAATLDTGGWLGLTRWGLAPHKKRQVRLAHNGP